MRWRAVRTTINYQHAKGMSTSEAMSALYAEGGIRRFYQGMTAALLQAPLSRFGDTAANAGMLALLAGVTFMGEGTKTMCASWAAALFRILITPIDAFKTTLQVQGTAGLAVLQSRIASDGILTLWSGALAASFATFMGHYPWFLTRNYLEKVVPPAKGALKLIRTAMIGFCSSMVSDIVSKCADASSLYPLCPARVPRATHLPHLAPPPRSARSAWSRPPSRPRRSPCPTWLPSTRSSRSTAFRASSSAALAPSSSRTECLR